MKYVDLTSIHYRLEPQPKPTAMEEIRRRDLAELKMGIWFGALGGAFGAVAFLIVWWISRP